VAQWRNGNVSLSNNGISYVSASMAKIIAGVSRYYSYSACPNILNQSVIGLKLATEGAIRLWLSKCEAMTNLKCDSPV
jgi:hypothetical protein